jgi:hypothetical protein
VLHLLLQTLLTVSIITYYFVGFRNNIISTSVTTIAVTTAAMTTIHQLDEEVVAFVVVGIVNVTTGVDV